MTGYSINVTWIVCHILAVWIWHVIWLLQASVYRPYGGFLGSSNGKESACNAGDLGLIPGSGRSLREGNGNPFQYSCLENPHQQRSLMGYSPWGRKELDMTEWLTLSLSFMERKGEIMVPPLSREGRRRCLTYHGWQNGNVTSKRGPCEPLSLFWRSNLRCSAPEVQSAFRESRVCAWCICQHSRALFIFS